MDVHEVVPLHGLHEAGNEARRNLVRIGPFVRVDAARPVGGGRGAWPALKVELVIRRQRGHLYPGLTQGALDDADRLRRPAIARGH